ncbi:MAG: hypothetical protein HXX18_00920 [Bacteroidetes bacterium]|nr:hypothetical protein [Bacteroidota bacterium]
MNEVFNLKRFGLLFKEQTSKNLKLFLMGTVLVFAVLFVFSLLSILSNYTNWQAFNNRIELYKIIIFPTSCLVSGIWFTHLSKSTQGSGNLMLPVSAFERILIAFIINIIVINLMNLLIVLSIEVIFFQKIYILRFAKYFFIDYRFYNLLFLLQSLFLIGSLVFKKVSILKTGVTIFILLIIFQLINVLSINIVFRDIPNLNYNDVFFNQNSNLVTPKYYDFLMRCISYIGFPLIWVASYFKLKEKQG